MPLLRELADWVGVEMGKGKGDLHVNPVVIIEDLVRERVANKPDRQGRQKTRVVFVTDPVSFGEWHKQRDRYVGLCGHDTTLAYAVMLQILGAISNEAIEALYRDEQQEDDSSNA